MTKILFIGDVVGRPGRHALSRVLPMLRQKYQPDVVVVNVENMAHGKGVTLSTMKELAPLEIDVYTSGNHVLNKGAASAVAFEEYKNLIRPANYGSDFPGSGVYKFDKSGQHIIVINLNGTVFFEKQFAGAISNPFSELDSLLLEHSQKDAIILLDFHAEATSEKMAMGYYADGRVSAVVGTHTHIPTADCDILPEGTAYVTDLGMTGPKHSVLGASVEKVLNSFVHGDKFSYEVAESEITVVNGLFVETEGTKAIAVEKIHEEVTV